VTLPGPATLRGAADQVAHLTVTGRVEEIRIRRTDGAGECALASDGEHDCADPTREAECRPQT
jgi:hypothetical protein